MKTKILVLGAVVAAFTFTSLAAEPLLSPRAQDNQLKVVTSSVDTQGGTVTYVTSASPVLRSPRAAANLTYTVAGVANDTASTLACRNTMTASPKAIAACEANPAMPGCKPMTVAPLK